MGLGANGKMKMNKIRNSCPQAPQNIGKDLDLHSSVLRARGWRATWMVECGEELSRWT